MEYPIRKLVTIITEAQIERDLTRDLEDHGVLGYTITDARGRGTHGERSSSWSMSGNIRVEVICDAAHADELMTHLRDRYYQNYAMVMRPDKFR
jgi:nitrogen regulatory protein PII